MTEVHYDDMECMCCRQLMVQPTTLNCGHSFCRLCLVEWCNTCKKKTCMVCQKSWTDLPQVSVTLRNLIESHFGAEYLDRCSKVLTAENQRIIQQFESQADTTAATKTNQSMNKAFISGMLITLAMICIGMMASYFMGSGERLSGKPVVKWSGEDTLQWLSGLGPWAQQSLTSTFKNKTIDGSLLVALAESESELDVILGDLDELHRKAFKAALHGAIQFGAKPPQDFWEYKDLHHFEVLLLCLVMPDFPRTILLHLYVFEYRSLFLPLIHTVCPVMDNINHISLYTYQFADPTWGQLIDFTWKALFLPYFSIYLDFTWKRLTTTNFWVSLIVMVNCVVLTCMQLIQYYIYYQQGTSYIIQRVKWIAKQAVNTWFKMAVVCLLWNYIPTFACNIAVYYFGLSGPISNIEILIKQKYNAMLRH